MQMQTESVACAFLAIVRYSTNQVFCCEISDHSQIDLEMKIFLNADPIQPEQLYHRLQISCSKNCQVLDENMNCCLYVVWTRHFYGDCTLSCRMKLGNCIMPTESKNLTAYSQWILWWNLIAIGCAAQRNTASRTCTYQPITRPPLQTRRYSITNRRRKQRSGDAEDTGLRLLRSSTTAKLALIGK